MKIYNRLEGILASKGHDIKDLMQETGLTKFQAGHLVKNDAPHITRESLEIACEYLVKHGLAERSELPGLLFAASPERFWHMLCERQVITMCMGTRSFESHRDQVVIAADSILQANLTFRMTEASFAQGNHKLKHKRQIIDPHLVPTWSRNSTAWHAEVIRETQLFYQGFAEARSNRALICYGSIKSNPVIECALAASFPRAVPFQSEDHVAAPYDRSCPFMLVYRSTDPQPGSICGGSQLCRGSKSAVTGIHYEASDGRWACAPWTEETRDAAIVFYRFDKPRDRLEMVLGGYSGRGTRCLAEFIRNRENDIDEFWPPAISTADLELGAFVVEFDLEPPEQKVEAHASYLPEIKATRVISLSNEALERRLPAPCPSGG